MKLLVGTIQGMQGLIRATAASSYHALGGAKSTRCVFLPGFRLGERLYSGNSSGKDMGKDKVQFDELVRHMGSTPVEEENGDWEKNFVKDIIEGKSAKNFNLLSPNLLERLSKVEMTNDEKVLWKRKLVERESELSSRRVAAQLVYGMEEPTWEQIRDIFENGDLEKELTYLLPNLKEPDAKQTLARRQVRFLKNGEDTRFSKEDPHRPIHGSFFTGKSPYFQKLDDIKQKIEETKILCDSNNVDAIAVDDDIEFGEMESDVIPYARVHSLNWIKKHEMEVKMNYNLKQAEYKNITKMLSVLANMPYSQFQSELLKEHSLKASKIITERVLPTPSNGVIHQGGFRKTSSASVRMSMGTGVFSVNGKPMHQYFNPGDMKKALSPLIRTGLIGNVDCAVSVLGGGKAGGQSDAVRHGITKCLIVFNPELKPMLKEAGFVTRDNRIKERKKPGQKKARKKFTWVKR
eukprot:Nk52_evm5s236 gene=Nk52_evmTU5s236